jgi:hypothetical protein
VTTALERVTPLAHPRGTYEVMGSRGDTYIVNQGRDCSCSGFRYRHYCRHLELVQEFQVTHQAQLESDLERRVLELYR